VPLQLATARVPQAHGQLLWVSTSIPCASPHLPGQDSTEQRSTMQRYLQRVPLVI
jgi:hypothetical protein